MTNGFFSALICLVFMAAIGPNVAYAQTPIMNAPVVDEKTVIQKIETVLNKDCYSCPLFEKLDEVKKEWVIDLYKKLAPHLLIPLKNIMILFMVITGVRMGLNPGGAMEIGRKSLISLGVFTGVVVLLSATNGDPLAWMIIEKIESGALKLGAFVVQNTIDKDIAQDYASLGGGFYGILSKSIETSIFEVLHVGGVLITGQNASTFGVTEAIVRVATGLMLILPFVFVLGLFMAFLVEAMFKFAVISMLSPLLIAALSFQWSRAYVKQSFQVLLNGFLIIVFASFAMSLSIKVINAQVSELMFIQDKYSQLKEEAEQEANKVCSSQVYAHEDDGLGNEHDEVFDDQCKRYWQQIDAIDAKAFSVLGTEYFMVVVIGLMSVLLHLQSKTLASNISSAQDGAGAAAGVVGGGKIATGAALGVASRFVSGGARAAGRASPVANVMNHGLAGGAVHTATQMMGMGGGGANPSDPFRQGPIHAAGGMPQPQASSAPTSSSVGDMMATAGDALSGEGLRKGPKK
ncbi:hypothetical protein V5T82_16910 [Magnetovibrio sp. PR-2]|uniref:hypothetical protein n=1 Tax=Magnetovibrio sp. PR-2 TaxID=3120356 RepID=UPI002FCE3FB7